MRKKRVKVSGETKARVVPILPSEDVEGAELAKKRIGKTAEERLRWMLRFIQQDFDLLRAEELFALRDDLRWFAAMQSSDSRAMTRLVSERNKAETGPHSVEELRRIHAEVARGIRGLLADPAQEWALPTKRTFIRRVSSTGFEGSRFVVGWEGDAEAVIAGMVVDLILDVGNRIRACKECGTAFLPVRRQVFCSVRCSQRQRDRRKQAAKSGVQAQ